MASYYDLILGLIPLTLLGGTGVLHFGGVGLTSAVSLAGLATIALVGHALFVNGPVDASNESPASGGQFEAAD